MKLTDIESLLLQNCESSFYFASTSDYKIEYINPTLADILGKKPEDCVGKKCHEIIYRSSTPCRDCISKRAVSSKYFNFTTNRIIKKYEYKCINTVIASERGTINIGKIIDNTDYYLTLDRCILNAREENFDDTMSELISILKNYYKCDDVIILKRELGTGSFISDHNTLSSELNLKFGEKQLSRWLFEFDKQDDLIINSLDKDVPNYTEEYTYFTKHNVSKMIVSPMRDSIAVIGMVILLNPNLHKLDKFIYHTVSWYLQENFIRLNMMRELEKVNHIDTLTGCYNRSTYALALRELKNNPPQHLGVVYCNIDGLKKTNKTYGYKSGDKKLIAATKIMRRFFKEPFYRIGGDKFVCFVETLNEDDFYTQMTELSTETNINDKACFSVGCAYEQGAIDVGLLVTNASKMMYLNKQKYYQKSLDTLVDSNNNSLNDLLTAISQKELLVYFQPKINVKTNDLIGAEALVRRFHTKDNMLVFPDKFISTYETDSIIRHLDLNVLHQVCEWQSKWIYNGKKLPISVNFSHITLKENSIVKIITDICDSYNVPHELIMIELTEKSGLVNDESLIKLVKELKSEGFLISLDDFGCENSNITTISKIDVDEIKIDRSLTSNIENNPKNQIIIKSMIDMCNQIEDVSVLAEGVETLVQEDILKNFDCYTVQGFLYSKAIPADIFYEKYII